MRLKLLVVMAALALAGCADKPGPLGGAPGLQVIPGDLPPPTSADVIGPSMSYGVGPFDVLKIDVFGIPDLSNRTVKVDASGQIEFPLVGTLNVAGLQTREVSDLLESRLRGQFVRDPDVTTSVEDSAARSIVVYGSVSQPGVYPVQGTSTLLKSIATARGVTEFANSEDVVVFRTVNGQRMATLYNLTAISRGMYADPTIYPNDTVVVGESRSRRLFDQLVGAAALIATPITILLQQTL